MSKSNAEEVLAEALDDSPTIVNYDSDNSDNYEDASENHDSSGNVNDLTRPSEWRPSNPESHPIEDSTGHVEGSPDFIDEQLIESWESGDKPLSESELEQKRLEAAQYKLEGNALYQDGKIRDALGEIKAHPLEFTLRVVKVCPGYHLANI